MTPKIISLFLLIIASCSLHAQDRPPQNNTFSDSLGKERDGLSIANVHLNPLPATESLNLSVSLDKPDHLSVSIIGLSDQPGLWFHKRVPAGCYTAELDVSRLKVGNYMMIIAGNGATVNKPFTIAR